MHEYLEERRAACPYCGETIVIVVDRSAGTHDYIEDCQVCCRPILIGLRLDDSGEIADITMTREDE